MKWIKNALDAVWMWTVAIFALLFLREGDDAED